MVFILAVLLSAAVQVRMTTVDGVTRDASLLGVSEAGLQIDANGTAQSIALDEVLSITRSDAAASTSPPMRVELFGGSRIAASEVTTADASVVVKPRDQPALTVPLNQVRWIRFRPSSPAVDPQWLGMIDKPRTADVLVVRRAGNALDEAQGIVKSIAADTVTIDMDGDDLAAPIDKLEGVLFADAAPQFLVDVLERALQHADQAFEQQRLRFEMLLHGGEITRTVCTGAWQGGGSSHFGRA